jgi:glutamyl-tRNA synthetase
MNIASLRVAILNYIISRQRDEDFIVRIEDTDTQKNIEGKDQEILDLLALFGIEYSQVIHQSQNVRFHSAMALQLMHEKKAFSCFCSKNWIENKRKEAATAQKEYCYDDACRNLPAELVIDNTNPFCIRIARPDKTIIIKDKIKDEIHFDPDSVDSFVIMNQEKIPMYDFSAAVDDMLNDISYIVKDEKYLQNTPKQVHIRNSLAYEKTIEYAHIPNISTDDKTSDIKWLLEEGFLPEAILNYLVSIGNVMPKRIFTLAEAIDAFELKNVLNKSVRFDFEELKQINKEHLKNLDAKELSRYVGFADEEIGQLARVYLDEGVYTTKELKSKIAPIFAPRTISASLEEQVSQLSQCIQSAPYFEDYEEFIRYVTEKTALESEKLQESLRVLLTNAHSGPDLSKIYMYLKNYLGEIIK